MFRRLTVFCAFLIMSLVLAASTEAIVRVAPRWSFTEIYIKGGAPIGSYNGIPTDEFFDNIDGVRLQFEGSDLYKSGLTFGISIGQVRQHRFSYAVGFRYTRSENNVQGIPDQRNILYDLYSYELHQYDLNVDFNLFLLPIDRSVISPFVGIGTAAGITDVEIEGLDGENSANIALNLNFGAEIRISQPGTEGNFISLVSTNGWNIIASDDRPRYLWFGGGLKYYFKL